MKSIIPLRKFLLLGVALTMSFVSSTSMSAALAEEEGPVTVKVRVETKPEPEKAIGIILSSKGAKQVAETTIQKIGDKLYEVVFVVDRSELAQDSVATAMAISAGGDITFANVTPTLLSDAKVLIANIPECPSEDTTAVATINQLGPLQSLVDVRSARAELAQLKVARVLNNELLDRLKRFEEAFGLTQSTELSMQLPPAELVDRLSRINYAVKQYQVFKKPAK